MFDVSLQMVDRSGSARAGAVNAVPPTPMITSRADRITNDALSTIRIIISATKVGRAFENHGSWDRVGGGYEIRAQTTYARSPPIRTMLMPWAKSGGAGWVRRT